MCKNKKKKVWFPEPKTKDPMYANHSEHILDWLARSTAQEAIDYRKCLNYYLGMVPKKLRENFLNSAQNQWKSNIFELIVARLLQELGAKLKIEKPNRSGKKPDFLAIFPDGTITVEATSPEFDADIAKKLKERDPLLAIMESIIPDGFAVEVYEIPKLGPSDSKKHFKKMVSEFFAEAKLLDSENSITREFKFDSGTLKLKIQKTKSEIRKIRFLGSYNLFDQSEIRIRKAGEYKEKQVRGSKFPVILAIHASGFASNWENFDKALFGFPFDIKDVSPKNYWEDFQANGILLAKNRESPIYAGVLAFIFVDILYGKDPVLYKNPYFKGKLPNALESLEQRCFDLNSRKIYTLPPKNVDIMEKMRMESLNSK